MRRLVVVAAVALALCAPAGPAGAGDDIGPCDLLTRKQITRAFGQRTSRPKSSLGPTFCEWKLAASADHAPGMVNAVLERGKAATRDFGTGEDLAGAVGQPIEGIGTKAFYTPDTGTLFVLAPGPTLFYVQANVYDGAANRITDGLVEKLTVLAKQAEARL